MFSGNFTAHRFAERHGDYIEEGAPNSEVTHKVFKEPVSGLFTPNVSDNSMMTLAILFSLKTIELLENGLQPQSGATPLVSIRTVSLASSRSCDSIDADTWCKQALNMVIRWLPFIKSQITRVPHAKIIDSNINKPLGLW